MPSYSEPDLRLDFDEQLRGAAWARAARRVRWCLGVTAIVTGATLVAAMIIAGTIAGNGASTPTGGGMTWMAPLPRHALAIGLLATIFGVCLHSVRMHERARAASKSVKERRLERLVVAMMALYPFAIFPVFPELHIGFLQLLALFGWHPQGIGFGVAPSLLTLCIYIICWLLLPLRLSEVLFPLVAISVVSIVAVLISPRDPNKIEAIVAILVIATLVAVPGILIAIVRESRFVRAVIDRAVKARYIELREDLGTARRIHDRLLPGDLTTGPVLVDLAYEPMREIGGDMLFVHQSGTKDEAIAAVHVVLIDVTGHGITAALAVHRLHGELLRIYGTQDDPTPVRVMSLLNDYLLLTTSHDSLFATALVMRIDAASGALTYASAAHPDAMVRAVDGSVRRLASTTCVLGAVPAECFDAELARATLDRGETLILFTDGLNEATSPGGVMLGIEGTADAISAMHDVSPAALLALAREHRDSAAQDDCIIVRIRRASA